MSRKEIDAVDKQWQEAFKSGDAAAVARFYKEDGRILPPNAEIVEGRAAIEQFVKGFLAMNAKLSFSAFAVHESGNLAVGVGRYELQFEPEPGLTQKDSGKYIVVYERQKDGSLLLIEDMFNSSLPAS